MSYFEYQLDRYLDEYEEAEAIADGCDCECEPCLAGDHYKCAADAEGNCPSQDDGISIGQMLDYEEREAARRNSV